MALSAVLGVCFAASNSSTAGASTAPTAFDLGAQAQQLQAQIAGDGAALHSAAGALAQAQARVAAADDAITADQATLSGLQADLNQAADTLRAIALNQYMQDTDAAQLSDFLGSPDQVAATSTYQQLATANESSAVTGFLQAQVALQRQDSQLEAQRAVATAAYAEVSSQYAALRSAAGTLQGELDQVQSEQAAIGPPTTVNLTELAAGNGSVTEDLYRLRVCESDDNYQDNTGNGYYGAYQFALATWQGLGYSGLPSQAPPPEQDQAALSLEQARGWGEWPACAAMLGLN